MVAATKDRDTQEIGTRLRAFPMKAATRLFAGTMVHMDTSGNVGPGITVATGKVVGVSQAFVDNSTGAAGAVTAEVSRGVFGPFANSASADQILAADVDTLCYVVDDQTVAKTNGTNTRVAAGTVHAVDASGVWVRFV